MRLNPSELLTELERHYAEYRVLGELSPYEALRLAAHLPDETSKAELKKQTDQYERRVPVKRYMEYLRDANDGELAAAVLRKMVLAGDANAAQQLLRVEDKKTREEGIFLWMAALRQAGAEVTKPVPKGEREVTVSFEDLISGRAYVRLPFGAKVRLLEMAGAPWNEHDPDARLSKLQKELLAREERWKICHGGSGVGKSVTGGCEAILALMQPNMKIAIIASTYDKCHAEFEYVWKGFLGLFGEMAPRVTSTFRNVNMPSRHEMEIVTVWNSWVKAFSTDREEGSAILGKEFDLVILGEGALVSAETWQRKIRRALDRRVKVLSDGYFRQTGRGVMFTTPDGFDGAASEEWDRIAERYEGRTDLARLPHNPDWLSSAYLREAASTENPSYSPAAFEAARRTLPPDIFAEQYMGRRVRRSGLIYKEFDPDLHVVAMPPPEAIAKMRLVGSFDTGKHFSFGVHGMDVDGTVWRLLEVCTQELRIGDSARVIERKVVEYLGAAFGGASEFAQIAPHFHSWWVDARSQEKQEIMATLGIPLSDSKLEVLGSIDQVREIMAEDRYRVAEEGTHGPLERMGLRYEIAKYVWRSQTTRQQVVKLEPVKRDDHSLDEARYGIVPLLEAGPVRLADTKPVSFADNWQRKQGLRGLAASMRKQMQTGGDHRDIGEAFRGVHGW